MSRKETKAAPPKRNRWWKTPAEVRQVAANTLSTTWHLDMTAPWYRELHVKVAVLTAQHNGWRGYLHGACLDRWLDEVPDWLELVKPRGNWKCALCKQHAPPQELAA